ncbi:hypothetical protein D918_08599 [Trichuris suis]|nr:hypothetical protein D918_08599 [Trichuris suis]
MKVPCNEAGELYCTFSNFYSGRIQLSDRAKGTESEENKYKIEGATKKHCPMPSYSADWPNFENLTDKLYYGESIPLYLSAAGNEVISKRASLDLGKFTGSPFEESAVKVPQNPTQDSDGYCSELQSRRLSCFSSGFTQNPPRSTVFGTVGLMQGMNQSALDVPHFVFRRTESGILPTESSSIVDRPKEKLRDEANTANDKFSSDVPLREARLNFPSSPDSPARGHAERGCLNPILNDAVYARVEMETKLMRLNALKEVRYRDMIRSYQSLSTRLHEFHILCLNGLTENIAARAMALIAGERYRCVNEEIRRLYNLLRGPIDAVCKKCLGTLDLWNIVIPLNPLNDITKTVREWKKYAFICVMKYQETVAWSEVIYVEQKLFNKRLEFQAKLSIPNLSPDHVVQFSLYVMSIKEACSSSRSSMKEVIMKLLTPRPYQKDNTFPWNTDLQLAAVCRISLACANKRQFVFDMVNLPSVIQGSFFASIRYSCSDLNVFEISSHLQENGVDTWISYWCALKDGDILLWPSREDAIKVQHVCHLQL